MQDDFGNFHFWGYPERSRRVATEMHRKEIQFYLRINKSCPIVYSTRVPPGREG